MSARPARSAHDVGSGRGIGRAFALRFARDGYRVVVADLDAANAAAVKDEIVAAGGAALAAPMDVSKEADCERTIAETLQAFGRLDVLVNDAAVFADLQRKPFWEIGADEWIASWPSTRAARGSS